MSLDINEWRAFYEQGQQDLQHLQADVNRKLEMVKAGVSGAQISKMHAVINSGVSALRKRIAELESSLKILASQRGVISIQDIQSLENKVKKLRDGVLEVANKNSLGAADLTGSEKTRLLDRKRPGEVGYVPPQETEATRRMDDDAMLAHMQAEMHTQDEAIGVLSASVQRSKEMGIQIGNEVDLQSHLLTQVTKKVDRTTAQVKAVDRKIIKLSKKQKICCWMVLIFLLVGFLIAMFATNFFGAGWKK